MENKEKWKKKFYNSKAWLDCRAGFIANVFGICNRCGNGGYIVHHKIELNELNVCNVEISLNWEHLEYLCLKCHNTEHFTTDDVEEGYKFVKGELVRITNTPPKNDDF